jgi:hypothetical protein
MENNTALNKRSSYFKSDFKLTLYRIIVLLFFTICIELKTSAIILIQEHESNINAYIAIVEKLDCVNV